MCKILITDDAAFMRTMLKGILQNEGYQFIEAVNGMEMLEKVKTERPDLITLDITMPIMDGLEALKELKRRGDKTPVIMCSAMGQQAMVIDAIQHGAIDFIVKPFKPDKILDSVRKALH